MSKQEFIRKEMKNFVVNVASTHKIHIIQSDIYAGKANHIKRMKIICTTLTSVGLASFVLKILPEYQAVSLTITFILSLATTFINLLEKESDYKKLSDQTRVTANKFWELREDCYSLLYALKSGDDLGGIVEKFDELKKLRKVYNMELLNPSPKAVKLASKRIKESHDNDYTDDYKYFNLEDL